MNRKLIVPIVALLALLVKEIGGIELTDAQINVLVEGALGVAAFVGLFMNPKNPPSPTEAELQHAANHDGGGDGYE